MQRVSAQFQSVNLRISGPDGMYFGETFNQGDSIYFDLTTISALDGTYRWELRASLLLSDEVKDWLAMLGRQGMKRFSRSYAGRDNSQTGLGGYGCLHHLGWNPDGSSSSRSLEPRRQVAPLSDVGGSEVRG